MSLFISGDPEQCASCEGRLFRGVLTCILCGASCCTITCLQNHSDAKHGKAGIPKRGVDPRTQFLAIALVAIVGAFCLLAFWFTPEMVP